VIFRPPIRLVRLVLAEYQLPWDGIHGLPHWARVLETGSRLAAETGADPEVLALFALFHDSRRQNEGWDDGHGLRGAEFAASLLGAELELDRRRFDLLYQACAEHTDGGTEGDVTVLTCWDADRLDLGRVNITPSPDFLCTEPARRAATISWAENRSRKGFVPGIVEREWLPAVEIEP
jgi:uncharacterized protein